MFTIKNVVMVIRLQKIFNLHKTFRDYVITDYTTKKVLQNNLAQKSYFNKRIKSNIFFGTALLWLAVL